MPKISLFNSQQKLLMEVFSDGLVEFPRDSKVAKAFKEAMAEPGIAIPYLQRHLYDGKEFIKLKDREFSRAFQDVFIPENVENRKNPYYPVYKVSIEEDFSEQEEKRSKELSDG